MSNVLNNYASYLLGEKNAFHYGKSYFNINRVISFPAVLDPTLIRKCSNDKANGEVSSAIINLSKTAKKKIKKFEEEFSDDLKKNTDMRKKWFSYFREADFLHLGTGLGVRGNGRSTDFFDGMVDTLRELANKNVIFTDIEDLKLIVNSFGDDSLSDLTGVIVLDELVTFTRAIIKEHCLDDGIFRLSSDFSREKWLDDHSFGKKGPLPESPILLIPKEWINTKTLGGLSFFNDNIECDDSESGEICQASGRKLITSDSKKDDSYDNIMHKLYNDPYLMYEYRMKLIMEYFACVNFLTDKELDKLAKIK